MSFLNKAKQFLDKHDKQVDQALDKIGDEVDKRTHGKHTGAIDKAVDEAQRRTGDGDTRPERGR
jgi:MT0933-like antitoxin protein